jgi:hypothetical protein
MSIRVLELAENPAPEHKMRVVLQLTDKDGKKTRKTIKFGAKGYKDYTIYHAENPEIAELKKDAYLARHGKTSEDWTLSGVFTKGFWSRWILWNLPSTEASLSFVKKKFGFD